MKSRSILMLVFSLTALILPGCGGTGPLPPSDTTAPTVRSASPINGKQNVPVDCSVLITFSEAMDASSINAQTITLSTVNGNVEGSVTYSDMTAVFTPASSLNSSTWYTVTIDGSVRDAAGNAMGAPIGYLFRTGSIAQTDTTPPRVVDIQPSNRLTGVNTSTVILITFSEPMDPATLTDLSTLRSSTIKVSTLAGDVLGTVLPLGGAAIFIPDHYPLNNNTDYTVLVATHAKDLAGHEMADAFVSTFRTGTVNDTTLPSVVSSSIYPPSGSANVSVNTPISVTFSEPITTITPSNFIVSDGTATIPGNIKNYGTTFVFTPSSPLTPSTSYTVKITNPVMDLSGNQMTSDYSWSFTTEPHASDTVPPEVLSTYPATAQINVPVYRQIVALFSETMLVSSITPTMFTLVDQSGAPVLGQITSSGAMVVFTPSQPLAYNTDYTATLTSGATDVAGNPLASSYTWSFTTEAVAAFTIQASAGANGSISPSGAVSVNYGASQTFTITPNANYHVLDVLVDGSSVGGVTSYTFANVTAGHTISASFAINTFTITTSAGIGGTISPSNPSINYGANQSFTITPNTGYSIASVLVDGVSQVPAPSSYTFTNVTANHTISASFAINPYTITAIAGANGSINPSSQIVSYGSTTTFTVTPDLNYHIASVTGCGGSLSGNTYTTGSITGSCTVSASFAIDTFTIATSVATAGTGTISPANPTANYGTNQTFSITPATGYHVADVQVDGGSVGAVTSYTFSNVITTHTISASFAINTFTITMSAGSNGVISYGSTTISSGSTGTVTVNYNSTPSFTFTPDTGYYISAATVDGTPVSLTGPNSYTFPAVMANHIIAVSYSNITHIITASVVTAGTGTIDPYGPVLVNDGANKTFTITPATGYHIANVQADDASLGAVTSYTFTKVTADHTISASFAIDTRTVAPSVSGGNGSISPNTVQTVNYGATTSFTLTPDTGYHAVMGGTCGGTLSGDGLTYTTAAVTSDCTVVASFAINTFTITASAVANGSISPASQIVSYGSTTTFTVTPDLNYHIASVTGCGGSLSGNTYTTGPITGFCTVSASFAIDTFTITTSVATADTGTILPENPSVNYGADQSFTITPNTGYSIASVLVDGVSQVPTPSSYTFTNVTNSHTISATFTIKQYTVSAIAVSNGSLDASTPSPVTVNYNSTASFMFNADPGYHVASVTDDCGGAGYTNTSNSVTTYTYTTGPITTNLTNNCTVTASFAQNQYTLTVTTTSGGYVTIDPPSVTCAANSICTQSYNEGTSVSLTASAHGSNTFVEWSGACTGSSTQIPVLMDGDKTCTATFN